MSTPFTTAWTGTTDNAGNVTVTLTPNASYATSLIVAGQATGNPLWSIFKGGQFLLPGVGPQVGLGPIRFSPNEQLKIQITGATPNSTVTGTIWGNQSTSSSGLDLDTTISQSSSTVTTNAPQTALVNNWSIPLDGSNHSQTVGVASGQHSIGITLNPSVNIVSLSVVGNNTGADYAKSQTMGPQGVTMLPVFSAQDTQVTVTVGTSNVGGTATGTITAIFDAEAISISPQQPANIAFPEIPLLTATVAKDGVQHSLTIQTPIGIQCLSLNHNSPTHLTRYVVTGAQTLTTYLSDAPANIVGSEVGFSFQIPIIVPINSLVDTSYTINLTWPNVGGTATVTIAGLLAPQASYVIPAAGYSDLRNFVTDDGATVVPVASLPVSHVFANPAPWQVGSPDWQAQNAQNGSGIITSTNSGTSTGKRAVLNTVTFSLVPNASRVFQGRVWDGASGGTLIGVCILGNSGSGVGLSAVAELHNLKSSVGNALTFDIDFATATGERQAITASGWFA